MINVIGNVGLFDYKLYSSEARVVRHQKQKNTDSNPELLTPTKTQRKHSSIDIDALFQNRLTKQVQTTRN
jgi:hypothetical protein